MHKLLSRILVASLVAGSFILFANSSFVRAQERDNPSGDRPTVNREGDQGPASFFDKVAREIRAAVAAGDMTPEEGREKLAAFREHLGEEDKEREGDREREDDHNPEQIYRRAAGEIRAAIGAGRITVEQGRERLEALRERLGDEEREREGDRQREGDREREGDRNPEEIHRRAAGEIRAAIEAGRITPEQGRERLEELRRRFVDENRERNEDREREGDREREHEGDREREGDRPHKGDQEHVPGQSLAQRLEHLHQAIRHLHEAGFHEQGRQLEEIAGQIHRRLDGAERQHEERQHEERQHEEREHAEREHEGGDPIRQLHGAIEELHGEIRRLHERFEQIERELEERRRE